LIDFGSSQECFNPDGTHKKDKRDHSHTGNLLFSSSNICKGSSLSRRDDIESIIYMLIHLLDSNLLPWLKYEPSIR
jgi:hypothetical protein